MSISLKKERDRAFYFHLSFETTMGSEELLTREELSDKFGWEEWVMFGLLLGVSAAVGIYFWWKGQVCTM